MRAWWGFGLGAALIAAAYAADVVVGDAVAEARRTVSTFSLEALDAITRAAVMALSIGVAWVVFRGPRSRPVGLAMAVLGFYVGLLPQLMVALTSSFQGPPFTMELLLQTTTFTLSAASVVLVLGIVEMIRPTPEATQAR